MLTPGSPPAADRPGAPDRGATLEDRIEAMARAGALVIGVGNRLYGDDGVGSVIGGRLARRAPGRALDAGTVPENHLGPVLERRPARVLFVDAALLGAPPGSCALIAPRNLRPRAESTHTSSLALLADVLATEGIDSTVLGIEPGERALGAGLSRPVRAAAARITRALARGLAAAAREGGAPGARRE